MYHFITQTIWEKKSQNLQHTPSLSFTNTFKHLGTKLRKLSKPEVPMYSAAEEVWQLRRQFSLNSAEQAHLSMLFALNYARWRRVLLDSAARSLAPYTSPMFLLVHFEDQQGLTHQAHCWMQDRRWSWLIFRWEQDTGAAIKVASSHHLF